MTSINQSLISQYKAFKDEFAELQARHTQIGNDFFHGKIDHPTYCQALETNTEKVRAFAEKVNQHNDRIRYGANLN